MPAVQIELTTKTGTAITQAMLCTYCELYGWDCSLNHNLNYYDVLQDDPIWNKGILEELLDGEEISRRVIMPRSDIKRRL